jgi:hypothetical protein
LIIDIDNKNYSEQIALPGFGFPGRGSRTLAFRSCVHRRIGKNERQGFAGHDLRGAAAETAISAADQRKAAFQHGAMAHAIEEARRGSEPISPIPESRVLAAFESVRGRPDTFGARLDPASHVARAQ